MSPHQTCPPRHWAALSTTPAPPAPSTASTTPPASTSPTWTTSRSPAGGSRSHCACAVQGVRAPGARLLQRALDLLQVQHLRLAAPAAALRPRRGRQLRVRLGRVPRSDCRVSYCSAILTSMCTISTFIISYQYSKYLGKAECPNFVGITMFQPCS